MGSRLGNGGFASALLLVVAVGIFGVNLMREDSQRRLQEQEKQKTTEIKKPYFFNIQKFDADKDEYVVAFRDNQSVVDMRAFCECRKNNLIYELPLFDSENVRYTNDSKMRFFVVSQKILNESSEEVSFYAIDESGNKSEPVLRTIENGGLYPKE